MPELKIAITTVEIIAGVIVAMLLGDYLGHRIGGWRLATLLGYIILAVIIVFVVYAAIVLS